jgi:hypothetical protein
MRAIVSDPAHGTVVLEDPLLLAGLLADLLPDAPRESGLLVAAAVAGVPSILRGHAAQGVDPATAVTLAAAALGERTAFTPEICQWAASEIAVALGLAIGDDRLVPAGTRHPADSTQPSSTAPPAGTDPLTRSLPPDPQVLPTVPSVRPARRRNQVLAAGAVIVVAAVAAAVLLVGRPGSHGPHRSPPPASEAGSELVARRPPGGGYSVSLPPSWKFRNASYPSDHATHLWYDPANPLEKMQVVLSACVGCADQNLNPAVPDPAQLVPAGAASQTPVSPWAEQFRTYTSDDPYPDNGEIIVLQADGHVAGYDQIQLWLPASRHNQAAAILRSFTAPTAGTSPVVPSAASPRAVVRAYIAAINQRDWPAVWQLGGKNLGESYRQMVNGYRDTSSDVITSMTTHGDRVTVRILAYETTGPVQTYRLSYIVSDGTIITGQQTLLGTSG